LFEQRYVYGAYVGLKNLEKEGIRSIDIVLKKILDAGLRTIVCQAFDERGYAIFESRMWSMDRSVYDALGRSQLKHAVRRAHSLGLKAWAQLSPFKVPERDVSKFTGYLSRGEDNEVVRFGVGGQANYFLSPAYEDVGEIVFKTVSEILDDCEAEGVILDWGFGGVKWVLEDFSDEAYRSFTKFLEEEYSIAYVAWPRDVLEGGRYRAHYIKWNNKMVHETVKYVRKAVRERFGNIHFATLTSRGLEGFHTAPEDAGYSLMGALDYVLLNFVDEWNLKNVNRITRKALNFFRDTGILPVAVIGYAEKPSSKAYLWDEALKEALAGGSCGIILFDDIKVEEDGAWERLRTLIP